jgi:hypothetical protein
VAILFSNPAGDKIEDLTGTPVTGFPASFSCWYQTDNQDRDEFIFQIFNQSSPTIRFGLFYRGSVSTHFMEGFAQDAGGSTRATKTLIPSFPNSNNTWMNVVGVFTSNISREVWINAFPGGFPDTTLRTMSGLDALQIGGLLGGQLAEIGIWDFALTQPQIDTLALGASPLLVQPQNLVFYAPFIRDTNDIVGTATLTLTGTSVAPHPRVFRTVGFYSTLVTATLAPPTLITPTVKVITPQTVEPRKGQFVASLDMPQKGLVQNVAYIVYPDKET